MLRARAFFSVVAASSLALGGCHSSTDAGGATPGGSALEWRVEDRAITAANLTALWGFSASNVFVVGGSPGAVLHFDGTAWDSMPIPAAAKQQNLQGVWGSSPADLFAVGTGGTILHYDGSSWTQMGAGISANLSGVWGTSSTDVFAVGADVSITPSATVLHYDGTKWSRMAVPAVSSEFPAFPLSFNAVWGSGPNDVYAVGDKGTVVHYDGTSWTLVMTTFPLGTSYTAVWGTSAHDVFVGGYGEDPRAPILHYDGSSWTKMDVPHVGPDIYFEPIIHSFWGTGPKDVYATSTGSAILHYDGTSWSATNTPGGYDGNGIWGAGGVVTTVGASGVMMRRSGGAWTISNPPAYMLYDIFPRSATDIYVASSDVVMLHGDGSRWSLVLPPSVTPYFRPPLQHLWGTAPTDMYGGWLSSAFNHYTGLERFGGLAHYDGTQWTVAAATVIPNVPLLRLRGSAPNDVFATGVNGAAYHFDGSQWKSLPTGTAEDLQDFWEVSPRSVYAVGGRGTIIHFDGTGWSPMSSGTTTDLYSVWGTSDQDVYAGGTHVILHYDGSRWIAVDSLRDNFVGISGAGPRDVYVVGNTIVRHYDGALWTTVSMPVKETWTRVWVASSRSVYIIGWNRTVVHGTR